MITSPFTPTGTGFIQYSGLCALTIKNSVGATVAVLSNGKTYYVETLEEYTFEITDGACSCDDGAVEFIEELPEPVTIESLPEPQDVEIIDGCGGEVAADTADVRASIVGAENIIPVRIVEECNPYDFDAAFEALNATIQEATSEQTLAIQESISEQTESLVETAIEVKDSFIERWDQSDAAITAKQQEAIDAIQDCCAELQDSLGNSVADILGKLEELRLLLDSINTRTQDVIDLLSDTNSKLDELIASLEVLVDIEAKLADIEALLTSQGATLESLLAETEETNTLITESNAELVEQGLTLDAQLQTLNDLKSAFEACCAELKTSLTAIDENTDELEGKVDTLNTSIVDGLAPLTTIGGDLSSLLAEAQSQGATLEAQEALLEDILARLTDTKDWEYGDYPLPSICVVDAGGNKVDGVFVFNRWESVDGVKTNTEIVLSTPNATSDGWDGYTLQAGETLDSCPASPEYVPHVSGCVKTTEQVTRTVYEDCTYTPPTAATEGGKYEITGWNDGTQNQPYTDSPNFDALGSPHNPSMPWDASTPDRATQYVASGDPNTVLIEDQRANNPEHYFASFYLSMPASSCLGLEPSEELQLRVSGVGGQGTSIWAAGDGDPLNAQELGYLSWDSSPFTREIGTFTIPVATEEGISKAWVGAYVTDVGSAADVVIEYFDGTNWVGIPPEYMSAVDGDAAVDNEIWHCELDGNCTSSKGNTATEAEVVASGATPLGEQLVESPITIPAKQIVKRESDGTLTETYHKIGEINTVIPFNEGDSFSTDCSVVSTIHGYIDDPENAGQKIPAYWEVSSDGSTGEPKLTSALSGFAGTCP